MAKNAQAQETAATTVEEIVERIAAGKITPADGARLIAELGKAGRTRSRVVKLNSAGGLYVTDPSMRAYSAKKNKHYQAGLNLSPIDAVKALFANDELLTEIRKFLADCK